MSLAQKPANETTPEPRSGSRVMIEALLRNGVKDVFGYPGGAIMPLYDALYDMVEFNQVQQMIQEGYIEIAPLAYMRGRTLNDAFIILDEAQNSTVPQMKMFLTRLGFRSKMVVTGDITQVDLPGGQTSGLRDARKVLSSIADIAFCEFDQTDVVRHPIVRQILHASDAADRATTR